MKNTRPPASCRATFPRFMWLELKPYEVVVGKDELWVHDNTAVHFLSVEKVLGACNGTPECEEVPGHDAPYSYGCGRALFTVRYAAATDAVVSVLEGVCASHSLQVRRRVHPDPEWPTRELKLVSFGAYGLYTRFDIERHEYAGGPHGYIELLEVKDAPPGYPKLNVHSYSADPLGGFHRVMDFKDETDYVEALYCWQKALRAGGVLHGGHRDLWFYEEG